MRHPVDCHLKIFEVTKQYCNGHFNLSFFPHRNGLQERNLNSVTCPSSHMLAEIIANDLLSDKSGRFAMKILYRFINYNADWLQSCLGFSNGGVQFAVADTGKEVLACPPSC